MATTSAHIGVPETDEALMLRAQASDEAAFGELMQRWELPVKAVIARLIFNSRDAEELAQEAFVRLWQTRSRYQRGRPLKPWLLGIAVNLARNRLRWWKRRPTMSLEDWTETHEEGLEREFSASSSMESAERAAAVRDAIASLSNEMREALVLFEYEGMTYQEIADALRTSVRTVENRILRARGKLAAHPKLKALR